MEGEASLLLFSWWLTDYQGEKTTEVYFLSYTNYRRKNKSMFGLTMLKVQVCVREHMYTRNLKNLMTGKHWWKLDLLNLRVRKSGFNFQFSIFTT